MKSKAPLVLMEQTVMVLVFALAAAVCVRAFVLSDSISKINAAQDTAVLRAESAAEIYKNCRGDGAAAAKRYGGSVKDGVWTIYWDAGWKQTETEKEAAYRMRIRPGTGGDGEAGEREGDGNITEKAGEDTALLPVGMAGGGWEWIRNGCRFRFRWAAVRCW
jgi:hypothetical protein